MRFLVDESADLPLAAHLKQLGHDVTTIVEDYTRSIKDHEILSIANAEQRIVITNDRDFGELIYRRQLAHSGMIFLRLGDESLPRKIVRLNDVFADHWDDLSNRAYKGLAKLFERDVALPLSLPGGQERGLSSR